MFHSRIPQMSSYQKFSFKNIKTQDVQWTTLQQSLSPKRNHQWNSRESQDSESVKTKDSSPSVCYSFVCITQSISSRFNTLSFFFNNIVLFAPHLTGKQKDKTVDNIQTFRNYLHYHMKCSKAYLHTRMRERVRTFLQVLNRAKSTPENVEKKTITGRTFRRADDPPLSEDSELSE